MGRKRKVNPKKAARRLTPRWQDIIFTKASNRVQHNLGKFGPASPVRRICPKTGEVIEEKKE